MVVTFPRSVSVTGPIWNRSSSAPPLSSQMTSTIARSFCVEAAELRAQLRRDAASVDLRGDRGQVDVLRGGGERPLAAPEEERAALTAVGVVERLDRGYRSARSAYAVASDRFLSPSFAYTLTRWRSTVRALSSSVDAISLFE